MRKLRLFVVLYVLLYTLFVQTAHSESAPWDTLAPLNPEFMKWRYLPESVNALSGEKTYATGSIPDPIDRSHLRDNPPILKNPRVKYPQSVKEITIPAKYDMREDSRLPDVRNQNPWETCWAFAAIGSLESSYMTLQKSWPYNYRYDHTVPNLSELHTSYFVYGDTRPGKSFSRPNPGKDILNQSGNVIKAIALISGAGTVKESSLPYPNTESYSAPYGYPEDYLSSGIRLKEAYILANLDTEAAMNTVKRIILEQAGVVISYYAGRGATSPTGSPAYFDNTHGTETNHGVLLVGWDDNFSRENFSESMRPSRNGAWLVRNSWGKYDGSDNGYFWMSYEQHTASPAALIADKADTLMKHYSYDDLGYTHNTTSKWNANIFKAEGKYYSSEYLQYVGLNTINNNTQYEVYIYDLGVNVPFSPVAGKLIASVTDGYAPYQGYTTVELKEYPKIEKGHYFSVVVHSDTGLGLEGPVSFDNGSPCVEPVCNPGESYRSDNGTSWFGRDKNVCIKAFTVPYIYSSTPSEADMVQINARNFPDDVFRGYVSSMFDDDDDGWLSQSEKKYVTEISITRKGVTSLKGIEHFNNLKELDCRYNKLISLDLTWNSNLEYLYCSDNQLEMLLGVGGSSMSEIDCRNNRLKWLIVSAAEDLQCIDCRNNLLEKLYVIDCPRLETLLCTSNDLGEINLSGCPYVCVKADETASVKGWLRVNSANFPDVNFRRYVISEFSNDDDFLSPEEIADIIKLDVSGQKTASLKGIEHFEELTYLYCDNNSLTQLDVSENTELAELFCSSNNLTKLDLSKNTRLKHLECDNNQLSLINLSGCKNLKWLVCGYNKLTVIDITSCPNANIDCDEGVKLIYTHEETAPEILTEILSNAVTNQAYKLQLTASGTVPIEWKRTGKLPAGLTLSDSGLISGTPTKAGKSTFTVTAQNDYGKTSQKYTLQVFDPVSITTASLKAGTIGKSYSVMMKAKGTKIITWSAEGLPNGLTINGKGKITGKPIVYGVFNVKVKAENGAGVTEKKLQLTVKAIAPKLSGSFKKATLNESYSSGLKVTGSTPITWSIEGNLPDGLTLDTSTGIISGTPTSYGKNGSFRIKITATNDAGSKIKNVTFKVTGKKPTIKTTKLPDATAGEGYSAELTATGSEPITFTADLPEYLTLEGNTITGNISELAKNFKVKVYASNPVKTVSKTYTVKVITKKKTVPETYKAEKGTDITKNDVITVMPTKPEKDTEINSGYIVAAVLGEVSCDVSGTYDFEIEVPDYIAEGSELIYIANSDKPSDDDDIAEFYDEAGAEISAVPENRRITISIWLNAETVYNPVIAVKY